DGSGRMWSYNISGSDDEYAFIAGVAAGDYYIGQTYILADGIVYSLAAEVGTAFGLGYIEGRVTGVTGAGLENILVELYGEPFDWNTSRPIATTDANGYYRIGYFPGKYTVRFNTYNPNPQQDPLVADSSYLGKTYNSNEVLTLLAGATVPGIDAQLEPGGTITGRVTNSQGNGLDMAIVYVHAGDATRVTWTYTDAEGNYVADRIPTGNYKVRVRSEAQYGLEWYDEAPSLATGLPVRVMAGQVTPGIDIDLEQDGGHVQGRVTDIQGNPIAGVTVTAFDEAGINVSAANTDEAGNYDIPRLTTGQVRIYFNAANATGNYYSKYFPNEDLLAGAIPVPVTSGETTPNIDAQLSAGGTITGRVTDSAANGIPGISALALDTNSDRYYAAATDAAGNYTLANIRPDDYKVLFRPERGLAAVKWYDNWNSSIGAKIVAVPTGGTVPDINAQLAATSGSISGTVTGSGPIEKVRVVAFDSNRGTPAAYISATATATDGTYRIKRLPGANTKVYFDTDAAYLKYYSEYYVGKSTFGEANPITVPAGEGYPNVSTILNPRPQLDITSTSLPDGQKSVPYSASLLASGGRPFYYWSLEPGSLLPNGLTLNSNGEIRGTPTATGTFNFTVRAVDSTRVQWNETQSDTQALSITVTAYAGTGYQISGRITEDGQLLAGVTLNGLPGTPLTNAVGEFSAVVLTGWSGTVTPTRAGYSFDPPNRTYATVIADLPDQNYTALAGYSISGTVTRDGAPFAGALISGLPGNPRTDANGVYTATVYSGWSGTVTPTLPGFTFNPATKTYTGVMANQTLQNYTVTFQGGVDDAYEENDTFETARTITTGTYPDLVQNDEDWYKIYVGPADIGKDLKIHVKGTAAPQATPANDFDFRVMDGSGKLLGTVMSSTDDETLYISRLAEGWYYIGQHYNSQNGAVYSLTVEIGASFGIGHISGRVTNALGQGLPNIAIELYQEAADWAKSWPCVTTDANGDFKVGYAPGRYRILFNSTNLPIWDFPWGPDSSYIGTSSEDLFTLTAGTTLTGYDAQLDRGGFISGRVTGPDGAPLSLAQARAVDSNNRVVTLGWTKADGTYRISQLSAGNYKIRFISRQSSIAYEWYENVSVGEEGLPVPVQTGATTANIDAQLENWSEIQGAIHGHVTDAAGNPVNEVNVTAYDSSGFAVSSGWTGRYNLEDGDYEIWRLRPGLYTIYFNATTAAGNHVSEYYPDKPVIGDAVPVLIQGAQVFGIDAQLADAGVVTGRVTDPSGNGLYAVNVAFVDINSDRVYEATTDIAGNYTRKSIPPGTYRIRFRPPYMGFAAEWYEDKTSFATGTNVVVMAGQTRSGIDAQLAADGGLITGRVTDGTAGVKDVWVYALDGLRPIITSQARTRADGSYSVKRLPTASGKVQFYTDLNLLGVASEYYNNRSTFEAADPVQSTLGQTTTLSDAVLAPIPALTIATASLPDGQMGVLYSASLLASGGRPFYHFKLESGSLPNGLAIDGRGMIQGMPTATGT
ncbi:MAG: carboxypeptidase regulatory-like domain-containing protein, partial [Candidatus Aminicenantes bacterium]|nr:carboxypeptidase regulatory-like domain-containing protein [Candidatus Aminicenantes bacterium]